MSKKTGDKLFKLTMDDKVIRDKMKEIASLDKDISHILAEEREERDLRKADM
jgi:hypothetical protein